MTWRSATAAERDEKALFYLGPTNSSSYFHFHTNTYNALLAGAKHRSRDAPPLHPADADDSPNRHRKPPGHEP